MSAGTAVVCSCMCSQFGCFVKYRDGVFAPLVGKVLRDACFATTQRGHGESVLAFVLSIDRHALACAV